MRVLSFSISTIPGDLFFIRRLCLLLRFLFRVNFYIRAKIQFVPMYPHAYSTWNSGDDPRPLGADLCVFAAR